MKISIPITNGKHAAHFGPCEEFAPVDVNEPTKTILVYSLIAVLLVRTNEGRTLF
jgi:predicted Fe-Mo cluster-binding NifX family protein